MCWGRSREGQCDVPAGYRRRSQPAMVRVAAFCSFSCCVLLGFEQLTLGKASGLGGESWSVNPEACEVIQLFTPDCEAHTCGITDGAELLCWGSPIDEMLAVSRRQGVSITKASTLACLLSEDLSESPAAAFLCFHFFHFSFHNI